MITNIHNDDGDIKLSDSYITSFGMREFKIEENKIFLNGKRIKLHGVNLGREASYGFGSNLVQDLNKSNFYLVKLSQFIGINFFKSNYEPVNQRWLDILDRNGILNIVELPLAVNSNNINNKKLLENRLKQYSAILPSLWNHPSVFAYSLADFSTSSTLKSDTVLDDKIVIPFIKYQDPSRFVIKTGGISEDAADYSYKKEINDENFDEFETAIKEFVSANRDKMLAATDFSMYKNNLKDNSEHKNKLKPESVYEAIFKVRKSDFQIIAPGMFSDLVQIEKWAYDPNPQKELRSYLTVESLEFKNSVSFYAMDIAVPAAKFEKKESVNAKITFYNDTITTWTFKGSLFLTQTNPNFSAIKSKLVPRLSVPTEFKKTIFPFSAGEIEFNIEVPEIPGEYYLCASSFNPKGEDVFCQKSFIVNGQTDTERGKLQIKEGY